MKSVKENDEMFYDGVFFFKELKFNINQKKKIKMIEYTYKK